MSGVTRDRGGLAPGLRADGTARLILGGREFEFPIYRGTEGAPVIDIQRLGATTGFFTYDPGFTSTASCASSITCIDGEKGVLLYRGYPIEELAQRSSFPEVCYLLLRGCLPREEELRAFTDTIEGHSMLHEQMMFFLRGFRRDAHPMAVMVGMVGALSSFYHDSVGVSDAAQRLTACYRVIAKMPTIAAMVYKYAVGQPTVYPIKGLGYAENFLRMCFSLPSEPYVVDPVVARAMDRIFILHADHEQNASTSTVRLSGSSKASPFACVAAGIACLWGPAHGGANEAVLRMLADIGSVENIPAAVKRAKDPDDDFRLMGFGHRVYKNYDPRARIMQETCHEVLEHLNVKDEPLLRIALELERIALQDPYFVERRLYPNVDFYSGIVLRALGFPVSMFTALFALARSAGWVAQWMEMIGDPVQKIGRPRQVYTGAPRRPYESVEKRA